MNDKKESVTCPDCEKRHIKQYNYCPYCGHSYKDCFTAQTLGNEDSVTVTDEPEEDYTQNPQPEKPKSAFVRIMTWQSALPVTILVFILCLLAILLPYFVKSNNKSTLNFVYESPKDCYSLSAGKELKGKITIPASHNGSPVAIISDGAFSDCTEITEIVLPEGITTIGSNAFAGCTNLTNINLPESLKSIGGYAFYNCPNLNLTSIALPGGITKLNSGTFYGCSGLTSLVLPESITHIEEYAFYGCNGLTDITLPKNLKALGNSAFKNCYELSHVTFNDPSGWNTDTDLSNVGEAAKYLKSGIALIKTEQ